MDVSDGLAGDLQTLCEESNVGARLDAQAIPCDPHAARFERARGGDPLLLALAGGEDYQLLLTVAPEGLGAVRDVALMWGVTVTEIGDLIEGVPAVLLRSEAGVRALERLSYEHFTQAAAARRSA
jgi:thiamine-monophosphate kinase